MWSRGMDWLAACSSLGFSVSPTFCVKRQIRGWFGGPEAAADTSRPAAPSRGVGTVKHVCRSHVIVLGSL